MSKLPQRLDPLGSSISALAGWTIAANAAVLFHGNLRWLTGVGLVCAVVAILFARLPFLAATGEEVSGRRWGYRLRASRWRIALFAFPISALLAFSWTLFWVAALAYLALHMFIRRDEPAGDPPAEPASSDTWITAILMTAMALLALAVCRPDQDDAFYVGVAAFSASHPTAPLLAFDPMLIERTWPLIFPSYRFASYELLGSAVARALSIPAATAMHVVLPPIFSALVILSTKALGHAISPRRAWLVTLAVFLLTLLLGEMHRSPANFSFDRIFQGKAVLLSVVIPAIYALSFRYDSPQGSRRDLYFLSCAYLAAIGVSNFGMLAGPLAGVSAAVSLAAATGRCRRPLILGLLAMIPLPYLAWVAWQSHAGMALASEPLEPAGFVWRSVFGSRGQYLVAALLLLAPALAPGDRSRRLLAVPILILLSVFLNPLAAGWIAEHVTTPPVYWRVTWQAPVLSYAAAALAFLIRPSPMPVGPDRHIRWILAAAIVAGMASLLPSNTLRAANGITWSFATVKTEAAATQAADMAAAEFPGDGRLLAPDAVSSILAMRELHPKLVSARGMYIYMLRSMIAPADYERRMRLVTMVNNDQPPAPDQLASDLATLDVRIVVTAVDSPQAQLTKTALSAAGWSISSASHSYLIWSKRPDGPPQPASSRMTGTVRRGRLPTVLAVHLPGIVARAGFRYR